MRLGAFACAIALLLAGGQALAQTPEELDEARRLFDAGAQAYASGQFTAAIQAFEQAAKIAPKPAVVFSLAQAQRRQYFVDRDPKHLEAALRNFRASIDEIPVGNRRVEASRAIAELELMEARLDARARATREADKEPARLMIMTRTPGATVSVDGAPAKPTPLGVEVAAGKHRVVLAAPGHAPEEREVVAIDNAIVPVDVQLRELPAVLLVNAARGVEVAVDGRPLAPVGDGPAFEVPSGLRFVTVAKNGHQPFSQELELSPGERRALDAPLSITRQRVVSYALLGVAGAGAVVGGVFALTALGHESDAQSLDEKRRAQNITPAERDAYDDAVADRDRAVTAAAISVGTAAGVGVVGALLWLFDQPSVPSAPSRRTPAAPEPLDRGVELGIGPARHGAGAELQGRF